MALGSAGAPSVGKAHSYQLILLLGRFLYPLFVLPTPLHPTPSRGWRESGFAELGASWDQGSLASLNTRGLRLDIPQDEGFAIKTADTLPACCGKIK